MRLPLVSALLAAMCAAPTAAASPFEDLADVVEEVDVTARHLEARAHELASGAGTRGVAFGRSIHTFAGAQGDALAAHALACAPDAARHVDGNVAFADAEVSSSTSLAAERARAVAAVVRGEVPPSAELDAAVAALERDPDVWIERVATLPFAAYDAARALLLRAGAASDDALATASTAPVVVLCELGARRPMDGSLVRSILRGDMEVLASAADAATARAFPQELLDGGPAATYVAARGASEDALRRAGVEPYAPPPPPPDVVALAGEILERGGSSRGGNPWEEDLLAKYALAWSLAEDSLACGWEAVDYAGAETNQQGLRGIARDVQTNAERLLDAGEGAARPVADPLVRELARLWGPELDSTVEQARGIAEAAKCILLYGVVVPIAETAVWRNPPVACIAKATTTCGAAVLHCAMGWPFETAWWWADADQGPAPTLCTPPGTAPTPLSHPISPSPSP